jgi:hypothetical protein
LPFFATRCFGEGEEEEEIEAAAEEQHQLLAMLSTI